MIDEQEKKIKDLDAAIKRLVVNDISQQVTRNQEELKQLSEKIGSLNHSRTSSGEDDVTDEERALVKAGKYLEKQIENVNKVYDDLDGKISDMRKFMADVDEKERAFNELEDKLNKLQLKTENIIESELIGKSNEAIRNLEENKSRIMGESRTALDNLENKVKEVTSEIESVKQKSVEEIDGHTERLQDKGREVMKTIDEKIEYDTEHMKRVDEVVTVMNETVQKILGREPLTQDVPEPKSG